MEYWSNGVLEYRNTGMLGRAYHYSSTPFSLTSRSKLTAKARKANLQDTDHQHGKKYQQHTHRSDLRHPAVAPELPHDGRDDEIFTRAQRQSHGYFAIRQHADPDPAVEDAGGDQWQNDSTQDSRRRRTRYLPGFFQLAVHLNHHAVGGAGSVSDPTDNVRDGDDRDRAVNGENIPISQPEIAKAHGK